jgi:uracil-DNA glycosylase family 4
VPANLDRFHQIQREVVVCRRCPRLVAWREEAARRQPRRFAGETYWARPLPAFGDPASRILIVGLAPAAHGGNRTGRIFTGDESGNFLFAALHAVGLANRPVSIARDDGLVLSDALLSAACRCAPPDNRPTPEEFDNCREYIAREAALLPRPRVFVALGALAFDACLRILAAEGASIPRPRPRFAHGEVFVVGGDRLDGDRLNGDRLNGDRLLASYHPSQQNTFTGRLTQRMLRDVFRRAKAFAAQS